jgi:hypothetical protein
MSPYSRLVVCPERNSELSMGSIIPSRHPDENRDPFIRRRAGGEMDSGLRRNDG